MDEGAIAIGMALKLNINIRKINIKNNRIFSEGKIISLKYN